MKKKIRRESKVTVVLLFILLSLLSFISVHLFLSGFFLKPATILILFPFVIQAFIEELVYIFTDWLKVKKVLKIVLMNIFWVYVVFIVPAIFIIINLIVYLN